MSNFVDAFLQNIQKVQPLPAPLPTMDAIHKINTKLAPKFEQVYYFRRLLVEAVEILLSDIREMRNKKSAFQQVKVLIRYTELNPFTPTPAGIEQWLVVMNQAASIFPWIERIEWRDALVIVCKPMNETH